MDFEADAEALKALIDLRDLLYTATHEPELFKLTLNSLIREYGYSTNHQLNEIHICEFSPDEFCLN